MGTGLEHKYHCNSCNEDFTVRFESLPADLTDFNHMPHRTGEWMGERVINSGGIKHDDSKPMMALLPFDALQEVSKVLTHGANKYSPHNWRKGFEWSRLVSALLRHLTAWMSGEDRDPETGELHTAHMACCVLFLIEHQLKGYGKDDRYDQRQD